MQITQPEAVKLLTNMSKSAILEVQHTKTGMTLTEKRTKEQLIKQKFPNLVGRPITLTEAAAKYDVPRRTIAAWNYRSDYISPLDSTEYPARFDEGEIAYLAEIYHQRRAQGSMAPLLDADGLPYEIQHPKLAAYRRRRKKEQMWHLSL